jgi:Tfp pilus assembly protein PilF
LTSRPRPPAREGRRPPACGAARGALTLLLLTACATGSPGVDAGAGATGAAAGTEAAPPGAGQSAAAPGPGDPRTADALESVEAGERALAAGDATGALAAFDRASAELGAALLYRDADPDAGSELARRIGAGSARAYLRLGEPYLAGIEARRALNIAADQPDLLVLLGTSLYRQARFDEAEASFGAALRLDPASGPAHAGQGLMDLSANHLASARERFQRAYRLDGDPERLRVLARIAFIERDYGAAAARLKEYLERAPDLTPARRDELRERARVYARLKDGKGSRFASRVTRGQLRFDVARGDEVPLLPVRVNGRDPVYFIFDTGAQDHVLDASFARELGLELSPAAGGVESALGGAERRLAVVDSLNLGQIVIRDVPVSVADFAALGLQGRGSYYVAGVLNPTLLLRDFLIRVDFYHRTIDLQRYDAGGAAYLESAPALRRRSVPFRFNADGTGMIVLGDLGGSRGHPLLVDTGASDVYLSSRVGAVLGLDPLDVRLGLGDYARDEKLRAHFLRDPGAVEEGGDPDGVAYDGILGYPFFRDMRLVFDYYHGLVLIEN